MLLVQEQDRGHMSCKFKEETKETAQSNRSTSNRAKIHWLSKNYGILPYNNHDLLPGQQRGVRRDFVFSRQDRGRCVRGLDAAPTHQLLGHDRKKISVYMKWGFDEWKPVCNR